MNDIERNGATAVNTLDCQAAITGGSFSMKIGKTRFIVHALGTENDEKRWKLRFLKPVRGTFSTKPDTLIWSI